MGDIVLSQRAALRVRPQVGREAVDGLVLSPSSTATDQAIARAGGIMTKQVEVEAVASEEDALRAVLNKTKEAGSRPVRAPDGWISKLVTITKEEMSTPVGIKIANVSPHPMVLSMTSTGVAQSCGLEEGELRQSRSHVTNALT